MLKIPNSHLYQPSLYRTKMGKSACLFLTQTFPPHQPSHQRNHPFVSPTKHSSLATRPSFLSLLPILLRPSLILFTLQLQLHCILLLPPKTLPPPLQTMIPFQAPAATFSSFLADLLSFAPVFSIQLPLLHCHQKRTLNSMSSPMPTPPVSPHPSIYDHMEASWYDFIPPTTDGPFNPTPHLIALALWFRELGMCIRVIPTKKHSNKYSAKKKGGLRELRNLVSFISYDKKAQSKHREGSLSIWLLILVHLIASVLSWIGSLLPNCWAFHCDGSCSSLMCALASSIWIKMDGSWCCFVSVLAFVRLDYVFSLSLPPLYIIDCIFLSWVLRLLCLWFFPLFGLFPIVLFGCFIHR